VAVNWSMLPAVALVKGGVTVMEVGIGAPLFTVNCTVACCTPVATVIVRTPVDAEAEITKEALAKVEFVTVSGPYCPGAPPPTEIPGPKLACVDT
jgi:hypothetical protein